MKTITYQPFVAREPNRAKVTTGHKLLVVLEAAKKSTRPGASRRLAMENTPEGRASMASAKRVLGEALAHDGVAPMSALRLRAGLSQSQVAATTGIQQPMLSRIENGHVTDIQRSTMRALADAYAVSLDELDDALTATVAQSQRQAAA